MILSVITSYYNRPEALSRFKLHIENIKKQIQGIEFIVKEWQGDKIFSTAICHNRAVNKAEGEWLLKQDIDCLCDFDLYNRILKLIENKDYKFFANFGCKNYTRSGDPGFPCGNEYLCSKKAYLEVGGEPEFYGYGCEDYAMLYKLSKLNNIKLEYNQDNIHEVIREQLARKLNKEYKDYFFIHYEHESQSKENRSMFIENKKRLYNICKGLDI